MYKLSPSDKPVRGTNPRVNTGVLCHVLQEQFAEAEFGKILELDDFHFESSRKALNVLNRVRNHFNEREFVLGYRVACGYREVVKGAGPWLIRIEKVKARQF